CAVQDEFFYKRCDAYYSMLERAPEYVGCHSVPLVHSAVLISLRNKASDQLSYHPPNEEEYYGPYDDTVLFAYTATYIGMLLHICNHRVYGYVPKPADTSSKLNSDLLEREHLLNVKLQAIARGTPLPIIPELQKYVTYPPKDTLNCSKIFMINLERRVERKQMMETSFRELGLDVEVLKAVDAT
ncbi:jg17280, partial [Pararge aegeria aegeria]